MRLKWLSKTALPDTNQESNVLLTQEFGEVVLDNVASLLVGQAWICTLKLHLAKLEERILHG